MYESKLLWRRSGGTDMEILTSEAEYHLGTEDWGLGTGKGEMGGIFSLVAIILVSLVSHSSLLVPSTMDAE